MIDTCPAPPAIPIAIVGVGPTGESVLQRLRAAQMPNVYFLLNDGSLMPELLHQVGLLLLVVQLESVADCDAMLTLFKQVELSGFGTHTLYVVMQPSASVGLRQKVLAHYSLQILQIHADATVVLPGDVGEDLCTWLADRVTGLAQVVGNGASVGLDIHDLTDLLRNSGQAAWASAHSEGLDRVDAAAKTLCNQFALHAASGHSYQHALVWVQGARHSLKLSETRALLKTLSQELLTDAPRLVFGVSHDDSLGERIRVSALLCRMQAQMN